LVTATVGIAMGPYRRGGGGGRYRSGAKCTPAMCRGSFAQAGVSFGKWCRTSVGTGYNVIAIRWQLGGWPVRGFLLSQPRARV